MVFDVVRPMFENEFYQTVVEFPNLDAQSFYGILHVVQSALWEGCYNTMTQFMGEAIYVENQVLADF